MLDSVFIHIVSLGLFLLFVSAGFDKFKHRQAFSQVLAGYQILPVSLIPSAVVVIPLAEITLASAVLRSQSTLAVTAIAGLLAVYGVAIFINIRRGNLSLDCGCQFGEVRQSISMALVYRNFFLVGATLLLLLPAVDRLLGAYDYGAIIFGVSMSALFYIIMNKLIANATTYREVF